LTSMLPAMSETLELLKATVVDIFEEAAEWLYDQATFHVYIEPTIHSFRLLTPPSTPYEGGGGREKLIC